MKITKKNGNVVLYDDVKVINSILKANEGIPGESMTHKTAALIANQVFDTLTEKSEILSTADVRSCTAELLKKKGYPKTAEAYLAYKK